MKCNVAGKGDDAEDIAIRYKGDLAGIKLKAAISYVNYENSSSNKRQTSGSVSLLAE